MHRLFFAQVLAGLLIAGAVHAQSITFQGKIYDSSGVPLNGTSTVFRVKILAPNASRCVLYEETQTVDLSGSGGLFSLNINSSNSVQAPPTNYSLEQAISNRTGFSVNSTYCQSGSGTITYSPAATDNRKVIISFRDPGTMALEESIPEMDLNPLPYAIESRTVGGYPASSILRIEDSGIPGAAPSLTSANLSELQSLLSGTSNNYMSSSAGSTIGARLPTVSGNPTMPATGSIWFDTGSGAMKYYDGGSVRTVGTGSGNGTITGISAGAGLLGGGASGSVSLALSPSGLGSGGSYGSSTQVPHLTVDTYGRITAVSLQTISGTVPGAGTLGQVLRSDGSAWNSAALRSGDIRSISDGASIFPASSCTASQALIWNSGSDKLECQTISLGAPSATVANTYSRVTVAADGRVNGGSNPTTLSGYGISDALSNQNGISNLASGSDTAKGVAGTVGRLYVANDTKKIYRDDGANWIEISSAAGSGGTITDVKVDSTLARTVSGSEITVGMPNVGSANTYSKVTTDAQGRVISGATTLSSSDIPILDWTKIGSGKPTDLAGYGITDSLRNADGSVPSISSGTESAMPTAAAGNLNHLYIANDTKKIFRQIAGAWEVIGAAPGSGFTGSLAGEVTGTQGATQVASINGISRTTITSNLNAVSNATDLNTASTLVKRDSAGNFSAGAINANELNLKNGTNAVNVKASSGTAAYNLQLPAAAPSAGQSLQSDGSGVLSWVTAAAGSLTNVLSGTGISVTGSAATRTITLADTAVTPATYGSATQVPIFTVDQQGRLTSAGNVAISSVSPGGAAGGDLSGTYPNPSVAKLQTVSVSSTAPTLGQVLKYVSSNWSAATLELSDLKATDGTTSVVNSAGCSASQSMYYDTSTKSLRCQAIGSLANAAITDLDAAKLTGTIDAARLPASAKYWDAASGGINYAGGNVGIGTTNPTSRLHMVTSGPGGVIRMQNTDNAGYVATDLVDSGGTLKAGFGFGNSGASSWTSAAYFNTVASDPLVLGTNGSERLRVTASGNIGIATSSPDAKLHVAGSSGTTLKIVDGNQAAGRVLTSNAAGVASWADLPSSGSVTGVTASAPLASSGGTAPIISMSNIGANTLLGNASGSSASPAVTTVSALLDNTAGNAQGSILYRNASGWTAIAPGTSGQFLKTLGASANPVWDTVAASGGTVTNIATGAGLTGGPITTTGAIALANIANNSILANVSGSSAAPTATTLSSLLDSASNAQGSLLYRNSSGWVALSPGTSGQVLKSLGSSANLLWDNAAAGTVTSVNVAAPNMTSSGAVTSSGTVTLSYANQAAGTVLAAPVASSAAPNFRLLQKADLRSTSSGNPELFNVAGACSSGTMLSYNSATDRFECTSYSITSSQVTTALGYTPVNKAGDTMTGTLNLPTDGFSVGTRQLIVAGGKVGIGTSTPIMLLDIPGIIRFPGTYLTRSTGSNQITGNGTLFQTQLQIGDALYGADYFMGIVTEINSDTSLKVDRPQPDDLTLLPVGKGVDRMHVGGTVFKANGYVGIGTSTPGAALDIMGALRLSGASSGYVGFKPQTDAGSTVWTLPASDGSSGQSLTTDGIGNLSWTTPADSPLIRYTRSTVAYNASASTKDSLCQTEIGQNYTAASFHEIAAFWKGTAIHGFSFNGWQSQTFTVTTAAPNVSMASTTSATTRLACVRKNAPIRFTRTNTAYNATNATKDAACSTDFGNSYQAASVIDLAPLWGAGFLGSSWWFNTVESASYYANSSSGTISFTTTTNSTITLACVRR